MALSRARTLLLGRLRQRRTREREGLFLVEGVRGAREALEAGGGVRFAVCSPRLRTIPEGASLLARLEAAGVDLSWVEDGELEGLADTESPQGVLLVCAEPSWTLDDLLEGPGPRALVLDAVQDPGNVGTLLRAAAAFAVPSVLVLEGTVDPYNPKAVRAAAGAVFRTRAARTSWDEAEAALRARGTPLLVADAGGEDVGRVDPGPAWALAVGNEGAGCREAVRRAAARTVAVPMPGAAESLNAGVAGAILLYALTREGAR